MRTTYCLPIDAARKFDPEITQSDLDGNTYLSNAAEVVSARIEEAEDEFDEKTQNPQRLTHIGHGPEAWEYHDASFTRYQGGVRVFLDHRNILPIDPSKGDAIQVKKGRDDWRDITSDTDLWRFSYPQGTVQLFGMHRFTKAPYKGSLRDDNIRFKYRHGALGGKRGRAGQTELSAKALSGDSTIDVANVDRLPNRATVLVGDEYIRYNSVDRDNDQLQNVTRGARNTSDNEHDAGDVVHYCSMDVRGAVAAQTAVEMQTYEDYVDQLVETSSNDTLGARDKIDGWQKEWESILGRYSEAVMY